MSLARESAYPTPLSNSSLLPLLLLSLARQRHSPDGTNIFRNEYDYVIVGAGTAGSVVASRLSELPCVSVLLLEAGKKPPLLTEVPSLGRYLLNSDVDWKYKSVPQKYSSAGFVNRQLPWSSGKMIGGSSSLNSMVYVRGNMKNYDEWAAMGATGWSFNDVYEYFLKLEDNTDPKFLSNGYHSFGGPITVEKPRNELELKKASYEAVSELGYQIVDSNAARQTGIFDIQVNMRDNQRCSTAKAYLVPIENRRNLDIVPNAMVTKILIEDGVAFGVQFDFEGLRYEVRARKEVILSAGAMNTPQILMLSGIGPSAELQSLNIPVIADLPVGQNLQNHGGVNYPFVLDPNFQDFNEKISDPQNIAEYIFTRSGPLTSNDGFVWTSFLEGLKTFSEDDFPNYELCVTETAIPFIKQSGLKPEVYQQIYGPYENRSIFTCTVNHVQPKSRGTVTLSSNNPYDPPLIDPRYLADPKDVEDLVEGLKVCRKIVANKAMQKIGALPLATLVPGCEMYVGDEDEYFRCQIRILLFSFHHAAGTCKMGNPLDPTTVLDPELKVKNVNHLRVVDASVMPLVTSGNIHIPTIMIAEKASDMIKKTINCFGNPSSSKWRALHSVIGPVAGQSVNELQWNAASSSGAESQYA